MTDEAHRISPGFDSTRDAYEWLSMTGNEDNKQLIEEAAKATLGYSQIGDPIEDAIQEELATRTELEFDAKKLGRSALIRQAREHIDHYRRYDDTESLVSTLVEMSNALAVLEKAHTPTEDEDRSHEFANMAAIMGIPEPQGEPSDAQVQDALDAYHGVKASPDWSGQRVEQMRAALRAASVTEQEENR